MIYLMIILNFFVKIALEVADLTKMALLSLSLSHRLLPSLILKQLTSSGRFIKAISLFIMYLSDLYRLPYSVILHFINKPMT